MKRHGSLNHIFRLVWSQVLGCWVAVAENSRGKGKSASRKLIAVALSLSGAAALAAPGGGQVVTGNAGITQSGATTTITQASPNLSLNWNSFNIGASETVNFVQPGASSLAVNRIFDTSGSQILGSLNANGQVFLINPNGILFGAGAQVNVGALVASTLDFDQASLSGNTRSFSGNGAGSIVNQGVINAASGGYVALLGNRVSNQGAITAPLGSAVLGAGSAATLTFSGNQLASFEINQGMLNSLAKNGGIIQADGGMVILSAGARNELQASMVNNTGVIRARTVSNQPGNITLLGGMAAGTVYVDGMLDASAPTGGNGGFIQTSAAHVSIAGGANVTTLAASGNTGTWLIDPTNFTITSGGAADNSIGAATLSANLVNNNVTIATVAGGTEAGNINVNAAVAWDANQLKLSAHNDINIDAVLKASNTASLDLQPASGKVNVGFNPDGSFKGRVDFFQADGVTARTGTGFLTIGANGYNVIVSTASLSALTSGGHFALGGNVSAGAFAPIGTFDNGTFDGLGHTISGLAIAGNGLFGSISNTTIRNVGLVNGSVNGAVGTGALVGSMSASTISNSYSALDVTGDTHTGGLVGRILGTTGSNISNSHATGNVSSNGSSNVGGLVGSITIAAGGTSSKISGSYATGAVTGDVSTGGLVGSIAGAIGSDISNSYASGAVLGTSSVGGLVGSMNTTTASSISGSHATGTVNNEFGGAGSGGLVGSIVKTANISNSYATGDVTSTGSATGGLVGSTAQSGRISDSHATGNVQGDGAGTGGLVGSNAASGGISRSYALGNVESIGANTGGLVGSNSSGAITLSYALGDVNGGGANTGGLAGSNASGVISQSFAMGNVTGAAHSIADLADAKANGITLTQATAIKGAATGGLVGSNAGTLTDTYAAGNVTGYASGVGGLVGDNSAGTVANSYAAGTVTAAATATNGVGGLIGIGASSNSYRIAGSVVIDPGSTAPENTQGTAVTSADLKNFTTSGATSGANWDFNSVWKMPESTAGYLYPILNGLSATITATANNQSKTYDGQAYSSSNSIRDVVYSTNGNAANFTQNAATYGGSSVGARNAGTYGINLSNSAVLGSNAVNPLFTATGSSSTGLSARYIDFLNTYSKVTYVAGTLTVNKATLGINAVTDSKIYNGNTQSAGVVAITGLATGDSVTSTSQSYGSKNVLGTNGSTLSVNAGYVVNDGNGGNNYSTILRTAAGTITPKALTIAASGVNKVYDGLTGASVTLSDDRVAGDVLNTSAGAASFGDKNVGNAKAVDVTGLGLSGLDAGNYTYNSTAATTADITPKALTIDAIANNKIYDGNATAILTGVDGGTVKIAGLIGSETLSLNGLFNNRNVGNDKPVGVSGVALTGDTGLASNYTVSQPTNLKADITAASIVVPFRLPVLASILKTELDVLRLSPQVTLTGGSNVAGISNFASSDGASEVKIENAAELSLNMEHAAWSDKIIPSTMLGLNARLNIVDGGLQLNNSSVNAEDNK